MPSNFSMVLKTQENPPENADYTRGQNMYISSRQFRDLIIRPHCSAVTFPSGYKSRLESFLTYKRPPSGTDSGN